MYRCFRPQYCQSRRDNSSSLISFPLVSGLWPTSPMADSVAIGARAAWLNEGKNGEEEGRQTITTSLVRAPTLNPFHCSAQAPEDYHDCTAET